MSVQAFPYDRALIDALLRATKTKNRLLDGMQMSRVHVGLAGEDILAGQMITLDPHTGQYRLISTSEPVDRLGLCVALHDAQRGERITHN